MNARQSQSLMRNVELKTNERKTKFNSQSTKQSRQNE